MFICQLLENYMIYCSFLWHKTKRTHNPSHQSEKLSGLSSRPQPRDQTRVTACLSQIPAVHSPSRRFIMLRTSRSITNYQTQGPHSTCSQWPGTHSRNLCSHVYCRMEQCSEELSKKIHLPSTHSPPGFYKHRALLKQHTKIFLFFICRRKLSSVPARKKRKGKRSQVISRIP